MRILIAEDEAAIADQLAVALRAAGFAADIVGDGVDAWHAGASVPYDAIVLDIGLPRLDGLTAMRRWRESGNAVPVLLLTARGAWSERVQGIDAGADDYLAKPFHLEEVVARVRALVRRSKGVASAVLRQGGLCLDTRTMEASLDGQALSLTAAELRLEEDRVARQRALRLISYLMHHPDEVVSRTRLSEHLYEFDQDRDSNTIDVFIGRLRRKLGADMIRTVRGVGYRLGQPGRAG